MLIIEKLRPGHIGQSQKGYKIIGNNFRKKKFDPHKCHKNVPNIWWCVCLKQVIRWYICFEVAKAGTEERWPQSPLTKRVAIRSGERSTFCGQIHWALQWLAQTGARPATALTGYFYIDNYEPPLPLSLPT